jgi:hypothetical protein
MRLRGCFCVPISECGKAIAFMCLLSPAEYPLLPAPIPPADVTARRKRESDLREGSGFMSTNILKKLVEQFAPENIRNAVRDIETAAAMERDARAERLDRERCLLRAMDEISPVKVVFAKAQNEIPCRA